jgi:hypothetical protein
MCIPLKKSSVNENRTFRSKIRGKIGFWGWKRDAGGGKRNLQIQFVLPQLSLGPI